MQIKGQNSRFKTSSGRKILNTADPSHQVGPSCKATHAVPLSAGRKRGSAKAELGFLHQGHGLHSTTHYNVICLLLKIYQDLKWNSITV